MKLNVVESGLPLRLQRQGAEQAVWLSSEPE